MFCVYVLFQNRLDKIDTTTTLARAIALALANWHQNGVSSQLMTIADRWGRTVAVLFSTEPERVTITTMTRGKGRCKVVHCPDQQIVQPEQCTPSNEYNIRSTQLFGVAVPSPVKLKEHRREQGTFPKKYLIIRDNKIVFSADVSSDLQEYLDNIANEDGSELYYGDEMIGRVTAGRIVYCSCVDHCNE